MTDSSSFDRRWTGRRVFGASFLLLLAMLVTGVVAYNLGISHGAAQAGLTSPTQVSPPYYVYGPRPWGLGFLFPFAFFAFWFVVARMFFWAGPWRHGGRWGHDGGGAARRFDDWHRQAHERMSAEGRQADSPQAHG